VPNGGFDFFGALGDAFNSLFNSLFSLLVSLINFILYVLNLLLNVLFAVVRFLSKAFRILLRGFKHIISDIVHGRFLHLYRDYLELKRKIKAWFEKHLPWLLQLRKRFDLWYRGTIIPILNLIQRLRAILAALRIFHIKFAAKLDALLGALESKIIRNTLKLRQFNNQIVSFLELIFDPGLFIRHNVLITSAARAIRGLFNSLGLGFGRALTAAELASQDRDGQSITRAGVAAEAASHPDKGLSPELLLELDNAETALPPLAGDPENRFV